MKAGSKHALGMIAAVAAAWTTAAMAGAQQPNLPGRAWMTFNDTNGPPWPIAVQAPSGLGTYVFIEALPNSPFVIGGSTGGLLTGQAAFGGTFDLAPAGFGVVVNGFSQPLFTVGGTGHFAAQFPVNPATPVGFQIAYQAAIADWMSPFGITLSAATLVTVAPGLTVVPIALGNNNSVFFSLAPFGITIPFYNATWGGFWVNSNGSITFGAGDPSPLAGSAAFIAGPPRVAGLWCDLDPSLGGTVQVSVNQSTSPASVRCEFSGVPEPGPTGQKSFAMVLFGTPSGDVVIQESIFLGGAATTWLVGIGPGGGLGPQPPVSFQSATAGPFIFGSPLASLHQVFAPGVFWGLAGRTLGFMALNPGTATASYVVF